MVLDAVKERPNSPWYISFLSALGKQADHFCGLTQSPTFVVALSYPSPTMNARLLSGGPACSHSPPRQTFSSSLRLKKRTHLFRYSWMVGWVPMPEGRKACHECLPREQAYIGPMGG
jgi:hypothetical protein